MKNANNFVFFFWYDFIVSNNTHICISACTVLSCHQNLTNQIFHRILVLWLGLIKFHWQRICSLDVHKLSTIAPDFGQTDISTAVWFLGMPYHNPNLPAFPTSGTNNSFDCIKKHVMNIDVNIEQCIYMCWDLNERHSRLSKHTPHKLTGNDSISYEMFTSCDVNTYDELSEKLRGALPLSERSC